MQRTRNRFSSPLYESWLNWFCLRCIVYYMLDCCRLQRVRSLCTIQTAAALLGVHCIYCIQVNNGFECALSMSWLLLFVHLRTTMRCCRCRLPNIHVGGGGNYTLIHFEYFTCYVCAWSKSFRPRLWIIIDTCIKGRATGCDGITSPVFSVFVCSSWKTLDFVFLFLRDLPLSPSHHIV